MIFINHIWLRKFNKNKKSLERPILKRFSNNLKKITLKNEQNEKLKNVLINKDDNTKELEQNTEISKNDNNMDDNNEKKDEILSLSNQDRLDPENL